MTAANRGDTVAPPSTAVPTLPESFHPRPWTAAPPGPRRPAPTDWGTTRNRSPLWKDLYGPPHWLAPAAPFTWRCRQPACEGFAADDSPDQTAPDCQDLSRSPDPSTLRRWARVCGWLRLGTRGKILFATAYHRGLGFQRALPISARSS